MSKQKIATIIYHLKKTRQFFCYSPQGELYTVDELLSKYLGREVSIDEATAFLTGNHALV